MVMFGSSVLRGVVNATRTVTLWGIQLTSGDPFSTLMCSAIVTIVIGAIVYHYNFYVKPNNWRVDVFLREPVMMRHRSLCFSHQIVNKGPSESDVLP